MLYAFHLNCDDTDSDFCTGWFWTIHVYDPATRAVTTSYANYNLGRRLFGKLIDLGCDAIRI